MPHFNTCTSEEYNSRGGTAKKLGYLLGGLFSFFSHLLVKPRARPVPAINPSAGTCSGGEGEEERHTLSLSRALASTVPSRHPGLLLAAAPPATRTCSGPDPEHPPPSSNQDRPFARSPGSICPQVPLTVYCPSFGVSSSSRSCCLRAWKSSSERQRQVGAVGAVAASSRFCQAAAPEPAPGWSRLAENPLPRPAAAQIQLTTDSPGLCPDPRPCIPWGCTAQLQVPACSTHITAYRTNVLRHRREDLLWKLPCPICALH